MVQHCQVKTFYGFIPCSLQSYCLCFALFLFSLNPQQDTSVNPLAILVGARILQLWAWVSGGVYKDWCLDALEGSFTLNLIILFGTTMYINVYVKDYTKQNENMYKDVTESGNFNFCLIPRPFLSSIFLIACIVCKNKKRKLFEISSSVMLSDGECCLVSNSQTLFWSLSSLLNKAVLTLGCLNALVSSFLKRCYEWGLGILHWALLPMCLTYHYIALACRTFPLSLRRGNLLDFISLIPEAFTIVQEGRVLKCNCTNCSLFTWFLRILKCQLHAILYTSQCIATWWKYLVSVLEEVIATVTF